MTPFSGKHVEAALISVLKDKLPAYLDAMGLPMWRSVVNENDMDRWRQDQLPSLVVICPGLADTPRPMARTSNRFLTRWGVGVGMVVSAATEQATRELAQDYSACIRGCVMNNRKLNGASRGTDWVDERYDALEPDDGSELSIAGGSVTFQVEFDVDITQAPDIPLPVQVTSTDLEVELLPLEGA